MRQTRPLFSNESIALAISSYKPNNRVQPLADMRQSQVVLLFAAFKSIARRSLFEDKPDPQTDQHNQQYHAYALYGQHDDGEAIPTHSCALQRGVEPPADGIGDHPPCRQRPCESSV